MSNHLVFVFLCVSRQYLSPDDSPLSALESDAEVSAAPKLNAPVQQVGKRMYVIMFSVNCYLTFFSQL